MRETKHPYKVHCSSVARSVKHVWRRDNLGRVLQKASYRQKLNKTPLRTEEALKQEAELLSGNLEEWDARFRLRRMKRSDLLELARARGLKRYSKLNKVELREMLETTLFEE